MDPMQVFPRRATLAAPKGEWPYTEATPSGAAPTSPPEGVFRHKRRMELDELSGRTTGRLGYIGPQRCTPDQQPLHMEIEAPRPWYAGSNDPDLRCRGSDEVC